MQKMSDMANVARLKQVVAVFQRKFVDYNTWRYFHTSPSSPQNSRSNENVENQVTQPVTSQSQIQEYCTEFNFRQDHLIAVKMLLYSPELSEVFGQGGQRQKQITQQVKFSASQVDEFYPGIKKRVAQIKGQPDKVFSVLSQILPILHNVQNRPTSSKYNFTDQNYQRLGHGRLYVQILFPFSVCQQIIGVNGLNIKVVENQFKVSIRSQFEKSILPEVQTRYFEIFGREVDVLRAIMKITSDVMKQEEYQFFVEEAISHYSDVNWLTEWMKQNYKKDDTIKNSAYTVEFNVDTKTASQLIGKGGERVMELERYSKAKIQFVNDKDLNSKMGLNKAIITGSFGQVMKAQVMLAMRIASMKEMDESRGQIQGSK
eukprot:TRINITY_DN16474_c0_g1_i1.p1 TRINITY_DN16474_c0_g1~~TRINITY_DN16474_c0_g1_i1.p1  ORF type:complete len:388 (-),score=32.14 TRINITY_DN16474_c0_g1_i1:275-1393(-)